MNVFENDAAARNYDAYYETQFGKAIDCLEKKAIQQYLEKIPPEPMLELGCGTGHWTEFFSKSGFHVTATDISDAMLSFANIRKIDRVLYQKVDAVDLPFPDQSFGVIATITMLEFISDRSRVFQEIYRVLKSGGWLLVGSLNANSELGKTKDKHKALRHASFLTVSELERFLSRFGLPKISQCAYVTSTLDILDGTPEQRCVEGAFIAACVQKIR